MDRADGIRALKAKKELKNNAPKQRPGIKKRSDKQKKIISELKKMYPAFLKKRPWCEIQGPGCTKIATVVHHTEGRLPSKIFLTGYWMGSCCNCNLTVEINDKWARENGFKKSKF